MMRKIDLIVLHCSATRADRSLTPDDLETQHRRRGFNGTGYHYYIRKDGTVHLTRQIERQFKFIFVQEYSPPVVISALQRYAVQEMSVRPIAVRSASISYPVKVRCSARQTAA